MKLVIIVLTFMAMFVLGTLTSVAPPLLLLIAGFLVGCSAGMAWEMEWER